jgi:hypothetical protein
MKKPPEEGDKIRITSNSNEHSYNVGAVYTVTAVDTNDSTLRAIDSSGFTGNWVRWKDCEPASRVGWDFIKTVLPSEVVSFLSAFEGIQCVELHTSIKDGILMKLPNLHELIMEEHARQKSEEGIRDPSTVEDPLC